MKANKQNKPMNIEELDVAIWNILPKEQANEYMTCVFETFMNYVDYKTGIMWANTHQYLLLQEMKEQVDKFIDENLRAVKTAKEFDNIFSNLRSHMLLLDKNFYLREVPEIKDEELL